jgi:hypothetical protein
MDRMKTSTFAICFAFVCLFCRRRRRFIGYFSANTYHEDRTRIKCFVWVLAFQADHDDSDATRDLMCTE